MSEKLFNVGIKAIIKRGDEVLIVKNIKGFWEVPGGRMDGNETIEQTLHRGLVEELPNIKEIQILDIVEAVRVHKDIKEDASLVLVFFYATAEFDGDEPTLSPEHTDYKWVTKDEAVDMIYDKYKGAIKTLINMKNEINLRLAGCVITDSNGKILLLHRNTARRQQWEIPGGKLENEEETNEAAIREVKEELGVEVQIIRKLVEKTFDEDGYTLHYTWYLAKIIRGEAGIMEPESFDDMKYFTSAQMQKIHNELSPNTKNFLAMIKPEDIAT